MDTTAVVALQGNLQTRLQAIAQVGGVIYNCGVLYGMPEDLHGCHLVMCQLTGVHNRISGLTGIRGLETG